VRPWKPFALSATQSAHEDFLGPTLRAEAGSDYDLVRYILLTRVLEI
jgi:hypothetical protein